MSDVILSTPRTGVVPGKIDDRHRDHLAVVYVRQSTLAQVREHTESLARQYELREGPCYLAASETSHIVARDLATDERFPRYGPAAVEAGVRSQAGIRLFDAPQANGALNLYSAQVGAFEDLTVLSALFAHQAAVAIAYAGEVGNLRKAIQTRATIGKAVGIVMERYQLTDDRAFAFLTRLSQHRNVKLHRVAEEVVAASHRGVGI